MKKLFFLMAFVLVSTFAFANSGEDTKLVQKEVANTITHDVDELIVSFLDTCGHAGNAVYRQARSEGATHRQARRSRRAFVRNCRRQ